MKIFELVLLVLCLFTLSVGSNNAHASTTCVAVGDSIVSAVSQGKAKELVLHLVSAERDVIFKSIASPGASLAATDHTGYNNQHVINTLNGIGGGFSAYSCILVQAGTNDFGGSKKWEDSVTSFRRILAHARASKKKVLFLDPIWRWNEDIPNKLGHTLNTYRWYLGIVCLAEYSDVCFRIPREDTVLGTSAGRNYYDAKEVADGKQLHLNATGHRKMADWIKAGAARYGVF